ncbi:MAG: hypothetical protein ABIO70_22585 [Pseudomonadota bacterium]
MGEGGPALPPGSAGGREGRGAPSDPPSVPGGRRRRKRRKVKSTLLTGTSGEYLGRKPFPRVIRQRLLIVVCGPRCVGKSSVAQAIAGDKARTVDDRALNQALVWRVRQKKWSKALLDVQDLVIDGPVFLHARPGAANMVAELIRARCEAKQRTVLVEGPVGDGSVELLMDAVAPELRATLTLRFPMDGGRLRYALAVCEEFGLPRDLARPTTEIAPWCYQAVRQHLLGQIPVEEPGPGET